MNKPLQSDDPCYFMLQNGRLEEIETPDEFNWRTKPVIHREGCYICEDPEFSLMGLPLCYPCQFCNGHVAADSDTCDECGKVQQEPNYE